ncbi:hypothetical protein Lal_00031430 [Lupinus albus]|nr:hypothetical protein Lal_00031430 [Lupinus albus]
MTMQNMQSNKKSEPPFKDKNNLPSQTLINLKNVSAITLRSGKQTELPTPTPDSDLEKDDDIIRQVPASKPSSSVAQQPPLIRHPFPTKIIPTKKMEEVDKEILDTFRKVEVNKPVLEAIKEIPRHEKLLKDVCTHKRKLKSNERFNMGRNVSAFVDIPEKCKDPWTFTVTCIIGNILFENVMLDLGASINAMHMSVFKSLSLGLVQPTGVSTAHPTSLIDDVLIQVGQLIFPSDFYILDMEEGSYHNTIHIILGRPSLSTTQTKIDVLVGALSMEFGDKVVRFNIFDAIKPPFEDHSVFHIDLLHEFSDTHLSNFLHDFHAPQSLTDSYTCHACTDTEFCSSCIDEFLDIDIDFIVIQSDCTNPHICHEYTDFEMCNYCIDEFLDIVVDSIVHDAEPMSASFIPYVLHAPDWKVPLELLFDLVVYALIVLDIQLIHCVTCGIGIGL